MKQNLLFLMMALATTTWLGCSHTGKKNENTASTQQPERKLAGLMDAGIIGDRGRVILYYKDGNQIIIQRCEDHTILNRREDCHTKPGTTVAKVSIKEFKKRLKLAMGSYGLGSDQKPEIKDKRYLYQMKLELEQERDRLKGVIQQLEESGEYPDSLERIKFSLTVVEMRLAEPELKVAVSDLNQLVDNMVNKIIENPALQNFVFSKDKESFEFNILESYLRIPSISAEFARISAGSFQMGSPPSEKGRSDNEVLHSVTLTKDFEIQQTEVTQAQWFLVMGYLASDWRDFNKPAQVNWNDTQEFIKRLNEGESGYVYRLPTEAEWEFAARGGTQTAYSFGDDERSLRDYARYAGNCDGHYTCQMIQEVGTRKPNQYGLYDMYGNVAEWVQDWYGSYPSTAQIDPVGPAKGPCHVARGGRWDYFAPELRAASRQKIGGGFRLVRTPR